MILYVNENNGKKVYISEDKVSLLDEDVFASKKRGKNKIQLSYKKRNDNLDFTKNHGNLNAGELLNTGKMDRDNSDTYIVPLKGGIDSYNITSINGTEIMHYFKNKFAKMDIDLDGDGSKESYELIMADDEYREFFENFYKKVNNVVTYAVNKIYEETNGEIKFNGVSVYGVPSSSNFNNQMASNLSGRVKLSSLPVVQINSGLFSKDLSNLKKDTDFINKNKDYYNGLYYKNGLNGISHVNAIDDELRKRKQAAEAQSIELIDAYNACIKKILKCYSNVKQGISNERNLAKNYMELYNVYKEMRAKLKRVHFDKVYQRIKYSKPASIEKRSQDIWRIITPYVGKSIMSDPLEIADIEAAKFEIKNLTNDVRMGMMDYFKSNDDIVLQEMEKIKGTVFVIFDDNISGGATLSDICYQAKKLGINYIVPITFGVMREKYKTGMMNINKPTNGWNF
jgi:hypothetical protein